nr:carbon storage regulator [Patulibacter sp. SYSU D01012]
MIISRKPGEKVLIGDDIVVTVVEVAGGAIRLGIDAPRELAVYREELWASIRDENRAAAAPGAPVVLPDVPGTPGAPGGTA